MQSAPFGVFAFAMLIPVVLAAIGAGAAVWLWRMRRALNSQQPREVSDLKPGYSLVWGKVAKNARRAPLTGRPCAWYSVHVEELQRIRTGSDQRLEWRTVREEASSGAVALTDGKADCLVDMAGATVIETGWSEWEGSQPEPGAPEPEIHKGSYAPGARASFSVSLLGAMLTSKYRCRERYIFAGDPLFALGDAAPGDAPDPADDEDADSGDDLVRAGAMIVRKPRGAAPFNLPKPFVVSAKHPKDVAAESGLAVQGGLVLAVIGVVAAWFLIRLRYG